MTMPNWEKGEGYPPARASASRWAWEFLRRNPDYRADWERYVSAIRKVAKRRPRLAAAARALTEGWARRGSPAAAERLTQQIAELLDAEELLRCDGRRIVPLTNALAEPWGLKRLCDPRSGVGGVPGPMWHRALGVLHVGWHERPRVNKAPLRLASEAPHEIVLKVDLRLPHGPLMAAIDFHLRQQRELRSKGGDFELVTGRLRPTEYLDYLRILDADYAGATNPEICRTLWPNVSNDYPERKASKRLNKSRKAANALRDGGYLVLPFFEASLPPKHRRK